MAQQWDGSGWRGGDRTGRLDATTRLHRPPPVDPATVDPWGERVSTAVYGRARPAGGWQRVACWAVPAMVTAVLGAVGLTRPALWTDELATWGMTTTPWGEMWPVLRWVDAVLAPYYVLMRVWAELAGTGDLALRLPSLAAMAGTAAVTGALGARLAGHRAGLLAGLVFAVLPATSRFAQEARPYALTALLAVVVTYLLVLALDRREWASWAGYAAAAALLGLCHVIAMLLLVGHGWVVLCWHRQALRRWLVATAAAAVPLLPLLWLGYQQRSQVGHITEVGLFQSAPAYLTTVFGGVAVGLVMVALAMFSLPLRHPAGIFLAWAVLPLATLVLVSLVAPMLLPRYLLFTLPAWALLAGTALARLRPPFAVAALVVVALLGYPAHAAVRRADGHDEATRDVAAIIGAQARTGDGVVYADSEPGGGWTTRDTLAHYLPAQRRPRDVLLVRPPRTAGQLLAGECADVPRCLAGTGRVWVVRLGRLDDPLAGLGPAKEAALRTGYRAGQLWHPTGLTLALLVREPDRRD
ncbi:MAG TPA: glycosyltransferase family 39 protein [Micromonosporaceae bacterium]|nr:glycosyltransferase family 39 protein [Micromonosporaceae bacterium]